MSKIQPSILYLASQSARRRELLRKIKVRFRVVRSSYHEAVRSRLAPRALAMTHALGKARRAKVPRGGRWVLGADTIVVCGTRVLGKPRNLREAARMLGLLSGRAHDVYTAVVLRDVQKGKVRKKIVRTRVWMKTLSDAAVRQYHRRVTPLDKAGAYAIQAGPKIVRKIKGSYSNVVGLPLKEVRELLRKMSL